MKTPSSKRADKGTGSSGTVGTSLPVLLSTTVFRSLLLLLPVVALFFVLGLYVGSRFVGGASSSGAAVAAADGNVVGLPGTKNLVHKWSAEGEVRTLRGDAIESRNEVLRELLHSDPPPTEAKVKAGNLRRGEGGAVPPTILKSSSLHATAKAFMVAPNNLDSPVLILGAWIRMDEDEFFDRDMRTVVANKRAGCEAKADQNGFALYVNSWQSSDHKVFVEYGGQESGCHKLDSSDVTILPGKWHHVAFALINRAASLFIDGRLVSSSTDDAAVEAHLVQKQNALVVGQYEGGGYAFQGKISQLIIVHPPSAAALASKDILQQTVATLMMQPNSAKEMQTIKGLKAVYPLQDADKEIDGSRAKDFSSSSSSSTGGNHGVYHFPPIRGPRHEGVDIPLVDAVNGRPVTAEMTAESDRVGRERREVIKNSMRFVWDKYVAFAWGRDELKPLSRTGSDNWGGMGVTLVDSLDTLWIMGMKEEFEAAKEWVRNELTFSNAGSVSVFETTIRELGGLLSAYDLSGDKIFLDKAVELGRMLAPAFNSPTGIAHGMVNLHTGEPTQGWSGSAAILSEFGTLQLEFRNLAAASNDPELEQKAMRAIQLMNTKRPNFGLFPIKVDIGSGGWAESHVTFGALGDSFYEYLLKVWIQGGKKEAWLRDMYDRAIDGVVHILLKAADPSGLAFLSDWTGRSNIRKMDHLVCFMPGTMALGAYTDPRGLESPRAKRDLAVAKALMYTCREMYHRMKSGISPEYVEFPEGRDMVVGTTAPFYLLRPETAESLFILNQLTGDPIYREWAWEIFSAIEKHCRIVDGYGALRDVNNPQEGVDDRMESFFLAETMKYLYLAQDPDTRILLSKYVFNTEAHPTRIFGDEHVPIPP